MADHDFLEQLQTSLATDDNRCTSHPVFCVRVKEVEEYVSTDSDYEYWLGEDYETIPKEASDALEEATWTGEKSVTVGDTTYVVENCYRMSVDVSYKIVQSFFTNKGAEDYIKSNSHNLNEPHVYVASGYRNEQWINLRRLLPEMIEAWKTIKGHSDV